MLSATKKQKETHFVSTFQHLYAIRRATIDLISHAISLSLNQYPIQLKGEKKKLAEIMKELG